MADRYASFESVEKCSDMSQFEYFDLDAKEAVLKSDRQTKRIRVFIQRVELKISNAMEFCSIKYLLTEEEYRKKNGSFWSSKT